MGKVTASDILMLIEEIMLHADPMAEVNNVVYRMVHSFRKSHSCYYTHKKWRAETRGILRRTKAKGRVE